MRLKLAETIILPVRVLGYTYMKEPAPPWMIAALGLACVVLVYGALLFGQR